jgi:chromosome partitioning protein
VAQHFLADRVAYAQAMAGGNTAPELQTKGSAAMETAGLWAEVKSCFAAFSKPAKKAIALHG